MDKKDPPQCSKFKGKSLIYQNNFFLNFQTSERSERVNYLNFRAKIQHKQFKYFWRENSNETFL